MLLIQKGKPTKRYCDRCHKRVTGKACARCRVISGTPSEEEWREIRRYADRISAEVLKVRRNA